MTAHENTDGKKLDYFETLANQRGEAVIAMERRLADMQALCRRAHLILSEHWDDYTEGGYGPSSLLRHLERAADGKEIKDITAFNDRLVRLCNGQADKIAELETQKCSAT